MEEALRIGMPVPLLDDLLAVLSITAVLVPIILRRSLLDWYFVFYVGMIVLWPWEPTRFLVPLVPFLYIYICSFLEKIASLKFIRDARLGKTFQKGFVTLIVFFALLNVSGQFKYLKETRSEGVPEMWLARQRLFEWIEKNTMPDDVFGSMSDYQLYLYTNRQAVRPFGDMSIIEKYAIDYIVCPSSKNISL